MLELARMLDFSSRDFLVSEFGAGKTFSSYIAPFVNFSYFCAVSGVEKLPKMGNSRTKTIYFDRHLVNLLKIFNPKSVLRAFKKSPKIPIFGPTDFWILAIFLFGNFSSRNSSIYFIQLVVEGG